MLPLPPSPELVLLACRELKRLLRKGSSAAGGSISLEPDAVFNCLTGKKQLSSLSPESGAFMFALIKFVRTTRAPAMYEALRRQLCAGGSLSELRCMPENAWHMIKEMYMAKVQRADATRVCTPQMQSTCLQHLNSPLYS